MPPPGFKKPLLIVASAGEREPEDQEPVTRAQDGYDDHPNAFTDSLALGETGTLVLKGALGEFKFSERGFVVNHR